MLDRYLGLLSCGRLTVDPLSDDSPRRAIDDDQLKGVAWFCSLWQLQRQQLAGDQCLVQVVRQGVDDAGGKCLAGLQFGQFAGNLPYRRQRLQQVGFRLHAQTDTCIGGDQRHGRIRQPLLGWDNQAEPHAGSACL